MSDLASATATVAPALANQRATSRPMPAPDPVTSTRAPEWSMVTLIGSRPEHFDQPVHGSLGPPDDRRLVGAP